MYKPITDELSDVKAQMDFDELGRESLQKLTLLVKYLGKNLLKEKVLFKKLNQKFQWKVFLLIIEGKWKEKNVWVEDDTLHLVH